jgi:nucleoside-diphosphate-sugar epimerase
MKVLVAGGGGFIGSNLSRALVQRGDEVRVLDNFSTGYRTNVAELTNAVEVVEGELVNQLADVIGTLLERPVEREQIRRESATYATPGRTSLVQGKFWDGSRESVSKPGYNGPPRNS